MSPSDETPPLPVYAFVDLDDSLIASARKSRPGVSLQPAALLKNGETI